MGILNKCGHVRGVCEHFTINSLKTRALIPVYPICNSSVCCIYVCIWNLPTSQAVYMCLPSTLKDSATCMVLCMCVCASLCVRAFMAISKGANSLVDRNCDGLEVEPLAAVMQVQPHKPHQSQQQYNEAELLNTATPVPARSSLP